MKKIFFFLFNLFSYAKNFHFYFFMLKSKVNNKKSIKKKLNSNGFSKVALFKVCLPGHQIDLLALFL